MKMSEEPSEGVKRTEGYFTLGWSKVLGVCVGESILSCLKRRVGGSRHDGLGGNSFEFKSCSLYLLTAIWGKQFNVSKPPFPHL